MVPVIESVGEFMTEDKRTKETQEVGLRLVLLISSLLVAYEKLVETLAVP